ENRDLRAKRSLIVLQLRNPAFAPVLSVLAFPQNRAAAAAASIEDAVMEIGAANSLRDRCDIVPRERRAQDRFEFVLAGFSLQLLRSLIRFPFEILDLA